MSTYVVRKSPGGVTVHYEGKQIDLVPRLTCLDPLFDYGAPSDSATNLGYAILRHCVGESEAERACQVFAGEFLLKTDFEISIKSEDIRRLVAENARNDLALQEVMKKMVKIP